MYEIWNNVFSWLAVKLVSILLPDPKILLSLRESVRPAPESPENEPPNKTCPVFLFSLILTFISDFPSLISLVILALLIYANFNKSFFVDLIKFELK